MPVGDDLDFETRYRILRSTSSNSRFRTHAALEQRTGRAVMVHLVDAADPGTIDRIREQVRLLPPEEARHVLELATLPSASPSSRSSFKAWLSFPNGSTRKARLTHLPRRSSLVRARIAIGAASRISRRR